VTIGALSVARSRRDGGVRRHQDGERGADGCAREREREREREKGRRWDERYPA